MMLNTNVLWLKTTKNFKNVTKLTGYEIHWNRRFFLVTILRAPNVELILFSTEPRDYLGSCSAHGRFGVGWIE